MSYHLLNRTLIKKRNYILPNKSILALCLLYFIFGSAHANVVCPPGFFAPVGDAVCTPAPIGYYVPNSGATEPTIAPVGTFVSMEGAVAPTPAPPGTFVPLQGQSFATLASPGFFVAESGASSQTIAPPGSFVANSGAVAPTLAAPGTFVNLPGQTAAILAEPGYFAAGTGATEQTITPPGYFTSGFGFASPVAAAPGSFVSLPGQTEAILAQPGYFAAGTAATEQTITPPGYFTSDFGSTAPIAAAPGSYISLPGQTEAILAQPGYFAAGTAATEQTPAPPGFFTADLGSPQAIAVPPGTYASGEANTFGTICPQDSTSYGAAPACRSGMLSIMNPATIGPAFDTNFGTGGSYNLGLLDINQAGALDFMIANISNDLGYADMLTDLSLLDAEISGINANLFSLDGFNIGTVLSEQGETNFAINFFSAIETFFNIDVTFSTDQYASFGMPGQSFTFNFLGRFTNLPNQVDAPSAIILVSVFTLMLIRLRRFKLYS